MDDMPVGLGGGLRDGRWLRVPDYDNYVRHLRDKHPDRPIPDYATFFRQRQDARYGGGGFRCC
jgi:uncharacterized short protein YbdD (DUF466 family)